MDKDNVFNFMLLSKAAKKVGCAAWTLNRWVNEKKIRGVQIGREILINKYDLRDCEQVKLYKEKRKKNDR